MGGAGYGTTGRVLVVDRDRVTCRSLGEALAAAGYETACAGDDREAYALIPTLPTFRVLIVDVDLGEGTTGFDVARFGRRVIPQLRVIYMSGEPPGRALDAFGVPGGEFIQKPLAADDLMKRITEPG